MFSILFLWDVTYISLPINYFLNRSYHEGATADVGSCGYVVVFVIARA